MTKEPTERATEQVVIYLTPSQHLRLKILAAKRKTNVTAIMRSLAEAELKEADRSGT